MRDVLGLRTKVVGVVTEAANTYLRSFATGYVVATNSALTFADGMAVRVPDATALEVIRKGAERIVEVTEDEIAEAIRSIYSATHNCAEGAGAAALARMDANRFGWRNAPRIAPGPMSAFGGIADIDRRCFSRRSVRGAAGCCGSYKDLLFVAVTKLLGSGGKYG